MHNNWNIGQSLILPLLLVAILPCHFCAASEFFVSPDGDDGASGTQSSPWRSIAHAAKVAGSGDTVTIAAGTYGGFAAAKDGDKDSPLVFRAAEGAEVIVSDSEKNGLILNGKSHIEIRGIFFRDCTQWVRIEGGGDNTFRNCSFSGLLKSWAGFKINSSSGNRVLDCKFIFAKPWSDESRSSKMSWIPKNQADYIQIWRDSHRNLVQGCTFGEIGHVAIHITGREAQFKASRNIIRNNRFVDNRWKSLGIHNTEYTLVENNVFAGRAANFIQFEGPKVIFRHNLLCNYRDITNMQPDKALRGAIRLQSMTDTYKVKCPAVRNRIFNNLFTENQRTITNNSYSHQTTDNIFKNNIFYRNEQTFFMGHTDFRTQNVNPLVNNIVLGKSPGEKLIRLSNENFTLTELQNEMPSVHHGNIEAEPGLLLIFERRVQVGIDNHVRGVEIWHDSPCIDAGADLSRTIAAGEGVQIPVEDAMYFCDGFGMILGDEVVIGTNSALRIIAVDYDKNLLTLAKPLKWRAGEAVNLPFKGKAPDIGPAEYGNPKYYFRDKQVKTTP